MNHVANNGVPPVAPGITGCETADLDNERADWLATSQVILRSTWDNEADEAFNELVVESAGDGGQV